MCVFFVRWCMFKFFNSSLQRKYVVLSINLFNRSQNLYNFNCHRAAIYWFFSLQPGNWPEDNLAMSLKFKKGKTFLDTGIMEGKSGQICTDDISHISPHKSTENTDNTKKRGTISQLQQQCCWYQRRAYVSSVCTKTGNMYLDWGSVEDLGTTDAVSGVEGAVILLQNTIIKHQ